MKLYNDYDDIIEDGKLISNSNDDFNTLNIEDEHTYTVNLHPNQSNIYETFLIDKTCKFITVCCSRGFGKSFLAANIAKAGIMELLELDVRVPNKDVYIIGPTYDQVMDIYWPLLSIELGLEDLAIKSLKDKGRLIFQNNSTLKLLSYEAVERMRGKGAYLVIWDEVASCKSGMKPKEAWNRIIKPCITTRWSEQRAKIFNAPNAGRAMFIGTPDGYDFFYDLYCNADTDKDWRSFTYDYKQSPLLSISEIEKDRDTMDPFEFASEYLASFTESGNNVFYCFNRKEHVTVVADFAPPKEAAKNRDVRSSANREWLKNHPELCGEDVYCCIDFNVGIQATSFFALRNGDMEFIDETKGHPDTENLAKYITEKYKGHVIYAFPDPTGKARKSSAPVGRTDFSILSEYGIQVLARQSSPPIKDSVTCVNRKLKTASGKVSMRFHPRCKNLITSIERTRWVEDKPETAIIDKSEGIEHYSDGVRYATEYLFPISRDAKVRTGKTF
jgi:hypothetical protein